MLVLSLRKGGEPLSHASFKRSYHFFLARGIGIRNMHKHDADSIKTHKFLLKFKFDSTLKFGCEIFIVGCKVFLRIQIFVITRSK